MTERSAYEKDTLNSLREAVAEALDRKRRLGQYAVFWQNGRPVCIGPDAPAGHITEPWDTPET